MSMNRKQWFPVCSLCTKTKGHQMKLAVNVLKDKGEWFLTYCLSKLWSFFLQDVVDAKSLRVMPLSKKTPTDQGRKIS